MNRKYEPNNLQSILNEQIIVQQNSNVLPPGNDNQPFRIYGRLNITLGRAQWI